MMTSDYFLEILSLLTTFYDQVMTFVMTHESQGQTWWQGWRPDDNPDGNCWRPVDNPGINCWRPVWQPVMMTLTTVLMAMSCDQAKIYMAIVMINNRLITPSLLLLRQVLLGKGLLECQRVHGSPCALVEVKDFLGSCNRCSLKNCLGILYAVFLTNATGTVATMIWCQFCSANGL